ncbi:MAG: Rrf2 family transcriptional regulator [Actinomycetota bacterium]|nr:Rrf2 family transcriptional regulator [Actinomycetota bacterium]
MKLTMQGEYAIRAMLELAREYSNGKLISAKELAARQDIPPAFLTKTLSMLAKAGLIVNQRGSRGGIRLAEEPSRITIQEVVEAIEGPFKINMCLGATGACDRKPGCKVHRVWHRAQEAMLKELSVTLDKVI